MVAKLKQKGLGIIVLWEDKIKGKDKRVKFFGYLHRMRQEKLLLLVRWMYWWALF